MKTLIALIGIIPSLFFSTSGNGQIKNAKTVTVNVYGNCSTCKKNIETAANTKKVSVAEWNEDKGTAILIYDSTKTTADAILKKIALAGYDNQNYLAPDEAYSKLNQCCQYDRKQGKAVASQKSTTHNMALTTSQNSASQEKSLLSPVYDFYFAVKDALVKGDGKLAATKAKDLYTAVNAVPMDKLPAAEHTVWMKYLKDLSYNAEHIKETTEVDHQREHFVKLSTAMYEVMKAIKADYPVYFDHCPMYNDGKGGDWLSKESGIKNPYYGSQMLTCGSTKEVIK